MDDPNLFVQPGNFYRSPKVDYAYYCDSTEGGTATMYLVKGYREGELIQAVYTQKLIYTARTQYELLTDKGELTRLRGILRKLRKKR